MLAIRRPIFALCCLVSLVRSLGRKPCLACLVSLRSLAPESLDQFVSSFDRLEEAYWNLLSEAQAGDITTLPKRSSALSFRRPRRWLVRAGFERYMLALCSVPWRCVTSLNSILEIDLAGYPRFGCVQWQDHAEQQVRQHWVNA